MTSPQRLCAEGVGGELLLGVWAAKVCVWGCVCIWLCGVGSVCVHAFTSWLCMSMWASWCQVSTSGWLTSDVACVPVRKHYTEWSSCLRLPEASSSLGPFNLQPDVFTCTQSLLLHLICCSFTFSSLFSAFPSHSLVYSVFYRFTSNDLLCLPCKRERKMIPAFVFTSISLQTVYHIFFN